MRSGGRRSNTCTGTPTSKTISIQKSGKGFTIKGIELLILNCDNLKVLKDPTCFEGVHENEVKILKLRIREENLDLRLEEEERIRLLGNGPHGGQIVIAGNGDTYQNSATHYYVVGAADNSINRKKVNSLIRDRVKIN